MKEHNKNPTYLDSRITHIRHVEDEDDQLLIDNGWEFAGLGMFMHNILSGGRKQKCFTKEQALLNNHLVIGKCSVCGMCADTDCCPPAECKCLYGINFKLQGNQQ